MDPIVEPGDDRSGSQPGIRLWLRLIGDFEANLGDGRSVLPVSKKARALLALIAAHMPQPLRRDFAAPMLWSGKPKEHAANSLRQALRELQIGLSAAGEPPLLVTGGGRLMLQSEAVWVDIHDPASIKWKPDADSAIGPLLLCQNLQGLDPALDSHFERLWKNLIFQQAFVPVGDDRIGTLTNRAMPALASPDADPEAAAVALVKASEVPEQAADLRPPVVADEGVLGQGWKIAVLPFRSLGQSVDGGLSLSLAEEISAALARFRMPRLMATVSFWSGTGPAPDALARSRDYNLDYVISGTIQASGPRIRVTVTLLDVGMDFEVIWASRFEGTTEDLFTLQDTIASQTVAQIDPELLRRHQFRGEAVRTANAVAHQAVLTAIQGIYRPDKLRFIQAKAHLERAIELDPDYAAAYAWLAYWYIMGMGQGWIDDPADAGRQAGIAAEKAITLDPLDARGLTIAGHVKAYILRDIESAIALHQRAISLNPNLPIAWALSACAQIYNGEHKLAIQQAEIGISLSPSDPHVFFVEHVGMMAHMFLKEFEVADTLASVVLERKPGHFSALKVRLAILGYLGRAADAASCLKQIYAIEPTATVTSISTRPPLQPADTEFYAAGLRLGGLADD